MGTFLKNSKKLKDWVESALVVALFFLTLGCYTLVLAILAPIAILAKILFPS